MEERCDGPGCSIVAIEEDGEAAFEVSRWSHGNGMSYAFHSEACMLARLALMTDADLQLPPDTELVHCRRPGCSSTQVGLDGATHGWYHLEILSHLSQLTDRWFACSLDCLREVARLHRGLAPNMDSTGPPSDTAPP